MIRPCRVVFASCCIFGLLAAWSFAQDQSPKSEKPAFPSPAGTYKYRIKADIAELVTDEKGDLNPGYTAIKNKIESLIDDASRFDLTQARDLAAYAKYVGKEIALPKGKQVSFDIKTAAEKELFVGKLCIGKTGEFELTPTKGK